MATDKASVNLSGTWLEAIIKYYGPLAFGLVSMLTIWWVIMAPQLDDQRLNYEQHHKLLIEMRQISQSLETTATVMERICSKHGNQ